MILSIIRKLMRTGKRKHHPPMPVRTDWSRVVVKDICGPCERGDHTVCVRTWKIESRSRLLVVECTCNSEVCGKKEITEMSWPTDAILERDDYNKTVEHAVEWVVFSLLGIDKGPRVTEVYSREFRRTLENYMEKVILLCFPEDNTDPSFDARRGMEILEWSTNSDAFQEDTMNVESWPWYRVIREMAESAVWADVENVVVDILTQRGAKIV